MRNKKIYKKFAQNLQYSNIVYTFVSYIVDIPTLIDDMRHNP